jgi:D-hexose-6-phosphate mutarotase
MDLLHNFFSIELIALIVSVIGAIISMVRVWQRWSLKMAEHKEFVIAEIAKMKVKSLDNEVMIKRNHDETNLSIEEIKTERMRIVERIDGRLERLESLHDQDMKSLHLDLEKAIDKIHHENKEDHTKLFDKIDKLTEKVVHICSTFSEYKDSHKTRTR